MKKNIMIVVILLVIIVAALMYFQNRNTSELNNENLPATDQADSDKPNQSKELYDLKSSIGNIIDDSVQEDIQKEVEDEMSKTTEPKK